MRKHFFNLVQILILFVSVDLMAQAVPTYSVPSITPGGFFDIVYDAYGYQYSLANLNLSGNSQRPIGGVVMNTAAASPVISGSCSAGHFVLWIEQGSEFDLNPTAFNVACEVYTNLSGLISSPISSTGNKVNILCTNVSTAITTNTNAAALASSYYVPPTNPSNPNPGIVEGMIYKALVTGQDPYQTLPIISSGAANFFHGYVAVKPSPFWSYSINTATIGNSLDFYSVCLHEALHTLGFASLINSNGYSSFGQNTNYFGRYDQFLFDYLGNPLIATTNTQCPTTNIAFSGSLSAITPSLCQTSGVLNITTCSAAVQYSSPSTGTNPIKVYTPNCWEAGSSLSHFEDLCSAPSSFTSSCGPVNDFYFVMSNFTGLGNCFVKRYPKEEEYKVLCDLGYSTTGTYSSNAIIAAPSIMSHTYSYGACSPSLTIFGVNDGILNNVYTFTTTGSSLTISNATILANDSPTNGLSVSCLESVYNNATVTAGANNFTVTAAAGSGLVLLKYVPVIGSQFGTATYVYVYFAPSYSCVIQNSCTMVQNGGFEYVNGGTIPIYCGTIPNNTFSGPQIDCWGQSVGGVNYYRANCLSTPGFQLGVNTIGTPTNSPISTYNGTLINSAVVGLSLNIGSSLNSYAGWLETTLNSPLMLNNAYHFSFWACNYQNSVTPNNSLNAPVVVSIAMAPSSGVNWSQFSFPQGLDVIAQFTIGVSTQWSLYSHTFTFNPVIFPINQARLLIGINKQQQLNLLSSITGTAIPTVANYYTFIDDLSIVPASSPTFAIPNPTICGNQSFTNLAQYATTTGTFSGIGVSYSSGQYSFNNPPILPNGLYPVVFTYTNAGGCTNTLQQSILISTLSPLVVSPATVCVNDALDLNTLLTNTSYVGGGEFAINGLPSSTLGTFSSISTHTITFTYTAGLLCNNTPSTVFSTTLGVVGSCCSSTSTPSFTQTSIATTTFINVAVLKIANSFTIQPGVELSLMGYEYIMGNNVKITVAENASLVIGYSHLYTCGNYMWEGIEVRKGGSLYINSYTHINCLIEDAKLAIDAHGAGTSTLNTNLNITNTTFNKNLIDLSISNYTNQAAYACLVSNCVFTCRNLPFTYTTWPQASISDLRSVINSTSGLTPPYIDVSTYSLTTLKAPYTNQTSHIAIKLNSVGVTTNNVYYGIQIGDATNASNFNLFDSHHKFIDATNSNVVLRNNVFQNCSGPAVESVFTATTSMKGVLDLSPSSATVTNRFWDCRQAISGNRVYKFNMRHAIVRSTQNATNTANSALRFGVSMKTGNFDYIISQNEFTNLYDGINISVIPVTINSGTFNFSYIDAHDLIITSNTLSAGNVSGSFSNRAINVSSLFNIPWTNTPACNYTYTTHGGNISNHCRGLTIDGNHINGAFRGIAVNGVSNFQTNIQGNIISLRDDNVFNVAQQGIYLVNSMSGANKPSQFQIAQNSVSGGTASVSNPLMSMVFSGNNMGIYSPSISCNEIQDSHKGFVFNGANSNAVWAGNIMQPMAQGLRLENAAVIGTQGGPSLVNANQWQGTWTGDHTYVDGAATNATNSVLWVKFITGYIPTINNGPFPSQYYGTSNNSVRNGSVAADFNCIGIPNALVIPVPHVNEFNDDSQGEYYIQKTALYRFLHFNDSLRLADEGGELATFYGDMAETSIDKFMQVEELLYEGNYAEAQDMLALIEPSDQHPVENNYKGFYTLCANYLTLDEDQQYSEADSLALHDLAILCPGTNGACIYQARALYNTIFGQELNYEACGEASGNRAANNTSIENIVETSGLDGVKIFPNPATNKLNIIGKNETDLLYIEIFDVSGRSVFQKTAPTKNKSFDLDFDLLNGIYFLTIKDSQNNTLNEKLIIAK